MRLVLTILLTTTMGFAAQTPVLELADLTGQPRSLQQLTGKPVILNFWATWCIPCREEMPMLNRVYAQLAGKGLVVIGASADDASTRARVAPFVKKHKLQFPVWLGATTADMERFGVGTALPATVFINAEGVIVGRVIGPLEESDLRHRAAWLIGEGTGQAPEPLVNNIEKALKEHEEESGHQHGGVALEGASSVPS